MAVWNKATEIEVPPCATCKGERFIRTHNKLKPCPTCSQPSLNNVGLTGTLLESSFNDNTSSTFGGWGSKTENLEK